MANYLPHSPLPVIVRLHQKFTMANNGVHVVFPTSFEDWLPGWIKLNPGSHFVCIGKYTGNDNISFKSPKKAVDNLGKPNKSPTLVTMNIQRTLTRFIILTDYGKVLSVQTTDLLDAGDLNVPRFTSNFAMKHVVHITSF
ncbi:uncharacterized protein LOC142765634 [Rhipicephalus microplus]|uniref:uncharacterized protein LOC142765634 n=1 Tax=Rhipicephalus microplus TaxID=6941 RepID=UPI003F6B3E73